jgi:hypothetical protein
MTQEPFRNAEVAALFDQYSQSTRLKLLEVRQLIFEAASETAGVGALEETLKWGQPSYLTSTSRSGSTIRIDQVNALDGTYAIYFNCKTTLVDGFRQQYPYQFEYEGNRSIVFDARDDIPVESLKDCLTQALTYHLSKKSGKRR